MATDQSKHSGSWDSSATWSKGVPTASDNATISKGENVTISDTSLGPAVAASASLGPAVAASVKVAANGELTLDNGALRTGSVDVRGEVLGDGTIQGSVVGGGIVVAQHGELEITGSVGADEKGLDLRIDSGATLKLDGSVGAQAALLDGANTTNVDFVGNGVLDLTGEGAGSSGELSKFQGAVKDFDSTDKIEVAGSGKAGDTVHFNARTEVLTVTGADGSVLDQITLDGDYKGAKFTLQEFGRCRHHHDQRHLLLRRYDDPNAGWREASGDVQARRFGADRRRRRQAGELAGPPNGFNGFLGSENRLADPHQGRGARRKHPCSRLGALAGSRCAHRRRSGSRGRSGQRRIDPSPRECAAGFHLLPCRSRRPFPDPRGKHPC